MGTIKAFTSLEQSKKLAEILPLESADMYYFLDPTPAGNIYHLVVQRIDFGVRTREPEYDKGDIAVWSLVALLKFMPFQLIENNNRFGFYQVKGFNKQGDTYRFGYKTNNEFCLFETSWYNEPIDAAFEMICWLKKNHKI